jgi:hypothetical protein
MSGVLYISVISSFVQLLRGRVAFKASVSTDFVFRAVGGGGLVVERNGGLSCTVLNALQCDIACPGRMRSARDEFLARLEILGLEGILRERCAAAELKNEREKGTCVQLLNLR